MCKHKSEVECEVCSHWELRTTDPCGNAPEGFLSGAGAPACDKFEPRQTVPELKAPVACSQCDNTEAAERVRRETVMKFWRR
jgi:hypothetical protein